MGVLQGIFDYVVNGSSGAMNESVLIRKDKGSYIVHGRTGVFGKKSMDVVSYGEDEFKEKFGNQKLRTLEEYKNEHDGISTARRDILEGAIKIYNAASEKGQAPGSLEPFPSDAPGYFVLTEKMLEGILSDVRPPEDIRNKINEALLQSEEMGEKGFLMGVRLKEISEDMKGHRLTLPPPSVGR